MSEATTVARLKSRYDDVIKADLQKQFNYGNVMEIPQLEKVVLNMGVGEAVSDSKKIKAVVEYLGLISGQQPVVTLARKSIATYKLPCHGCGIFAGSMQKVLMVMAITPWVSRNILFFLRSIMTRLMKFGEWTLLCAHRRKPMMRRARC